MTYRLLILSLFTSILFSTGCEKGADDLPILGMNETDASGKMIYHTIPDFKFLNQDGDTITQKYTENKIYVADFFFTTCPTICPIMKTQMLRVHEEFQDSDDILLLSHTINPRYDTPEVLKNYKDKLGVSSSQWQFLTGDLTDIYELAQKSYLSTAMEDEEAVDDGGFIHSGAFVLVDKDRHIRGIYDGTKEKEVDRLMVDLNKLAKL